MRHLAHVEAIRLAPYFRVLCSDVAGRLPAVLYKGERLVDPGRQSGSRDRVFGGEGAGVRHLAYAKFTPPRWATWPTPRALQLDSIPGVDARISFSFEGIVTH
jgi:hypothetical protein